MQHYLVASFIVTIVVIAAATAAWVDVSLPGGSKLQTLTDLQKKAVDVKIAIDQLTISLAAIVFGAAGFVIARKSDALNPSGWRTVPIALALVLAAAAVFFSHTHYRMLATMLSAGFFAANDPAFDVVEQLQVYSLLAAFVSVGVGAIYSARS